MARNSSDQEGQDLNLRLESAMRIVSGWNKWADLLVGGLPPVPLLVWAILYRHAKEGVVTRANSTLGRDLGVSKETIKRAIKLLRREKLLQVVRQGGMHVGATTYRLAVRHLKQSAEKLAREQAAATDEPSGSVVQYREGDRRDNPVADTADGPGVTIPAGAEPVSGPSPTDRMP
jgi:hypothetical protein